jgi:hypothetical protein
MAVTLCDPVDLELEIANAIHHNAGGEPPATFARARADRRVHQRLRDRELAWVRNARLSAGKGVTLVDLSAGGTLLDSPVSLRPASLLTLQFSGRGVDMAVEFRVLRCQVGAIGSLGPTYRAACEFTQLIQLPGQHARSRQDASSGAFVDLDVALKQLVQRAGPEGSLDADCIIEALRALAVRARKQPLDPIANPLMELLDTVLPAIEQSLELAAVLSRIEGQLRRTVPQASVRLALPSESSLAAVRSTLIRVPGAPESAAHVSIDIPRGVVLNHWQSRVLRVASRVIALLQFLDPARGELAGSDAWQSGTASPETAAPLPSISESAAASPPTPDDAPVAGTAWQKIVVRYAEGQILKGFTQDFSAMRSQFSLWPSITAAPQERVIVPLARLKAVFFVRDFAGNPGYVERTDGGELQHGRRIEVTLIDDEVIVGRTLSYRPDGHGFFVVPADPLANNIRVFIVSTSVRQVRFPEPQRS